ncbi:TPR repeat-containing protein [Methyloglobulus morosus KoM1]|uniref:Putative beta-barrel assembly-enhancing protease n=1 Tax=Methyloglobulus morosus KoM1 TaxID=1116472 RepID=V5C9F0_9GAMM|nr:M48 family metalloprotease [Methyloglobulus morosus]ESS73418.1 TPR repeat-containing protein [Methyloglobulus morosus KoM1]
MKLVSRHTLLALILALFPVTYKAEPNTKIELPDMGDSSGTIISPAEEKELGEAFFRSLHSQVTINQDAEIQEYIQSIGQTLVANCDNPSLPFHFFVVMENDINAFAGPGGYVGVNSGLIVLTEAESELASVMAHEIAHVTQRHLYRAAEAAGRLSVPTMAATLAAILIGTQAPALGQAAIMAIMGSSVQFQIDFTRENEMEADRVGMQTLHESRFDPRSMPTFFERLQQSSRYYGRDVPEFLRTHPVTASRISDTRGRAETYPYKQYSDTLGYQLTRAKLQVLGSKDDAGRGRVFKSRLSQGTTEQRTVARYGMGLVALKAQQYNEAESIFQDLVKQYPGQSQYATALARTALESKNYRLALARYQKLTEQFPSKEAIKLEYITTLVRSGEAQLAKKNLAALSYKSQKLPVYYELLAQVYSDLREPAESHRYLAEYYYAMGQVQDAVFQIRLAQQSKKLNPQLVAILRERHDFFLNEQIEARRNQ